MSCEVLLVFTSVSFFCGLFCVVVLVAIGVSLFCGFSFVVSPAVGQSANFFCGFLKNYCECAKKPSNACKQVQKQL